MFFAKLFILLFYSFSILKAQDTNQTHKEFLQKVISIYQNAKVVEDNGTWIIDNDYDNTGLVSKGVRHLSGNYKLKWEKKLQHLTFFQQSENIKKNPFLNMKIYISGQINNLEHKEIQNEKRVIKHDTNHVFTEIRLTKHSKTYLILFPEKNNHLFTNESTYPRRYLKIDTLDTKKVYLLSMYEDNYKEITEKDRKKIIDIVKEKDPEMLEKDKNKFSPFTMTRTKGKMFFWFDIETLALLKFQSFLYTKEGLTMKYETISDVKFEK